MKQKVLIIEDDEILRDELSKLLTKGGYENFIITDFNKIEKQIEDYNPDLILLDINLPQANGLEICQKLRKKRKTPIIFVTANNNDETELRSIMVGGDDFIAKPYNKSILIQKVKRVIEKNNIINHKEIVVKDVILDLHLSMIRYQDQELELTKNEFKILYYLFLNPDKIISSEELIEHLWVNKFYVDENILNVNVARIRKKLEDIGLKNFVQNIRGQGFKI